MQQQQQQPRQEEEATTSSGDCPGPLSLSGEQLAAAAASLGARLQAAEDAAYNWRDDTCPPHLFSAAVPEGAGVEVVVLAEGEAA